MIKYILIFSITVVQQFLSADNSAVVIDINEFANFSEIEKPSTESAVKKLKKQFGSRFPVISFSSQQDGTPNFPIQRNIKKVITAGAGKQILFVKTHFVVDGKQLLITCADSKKDDSVSFIKSTDFKTKSAILILQSPVAVNEQMIKAFKNSFENFNGLALLAEKIDFEFWLTLYKKPAEEWKIPALEKIKQGNTLTGKAISLSQQDIQKLKENCFLAKKDAENASAANLATATFTSATMKLQLLDEAKTNDPVQKYFIWVNITESFEKSRAEALQKSFSRISQTMKAETLKDFGHPSWSQMIKLKESSVKSFKDQNFKVAGDEILKASETLKKIFDDVTKNLQTLIKNAREKGNSDSSAGLINSLISLRPELKLEFAFPGQEYINNAGIKFVYIPAGKFTMGSPTTEAGHEGDETQHEVTISKGFYMSTTEISENQWQQVMGLNYLSDQKISPSEINNSLGSNYPKNVSWREAVKFCQQLSKKEKLTYRLPTEAEWEYCARAGSTKAFSLGDVLTPNQAVTKESRQKLSPNPCGSTGPNAWGLYDMHGNLWEWCSDWSYIYENNAQTDPVGPSDKFAREEELDMKIVRGGSFDDPAIKARSANRWEYSPSVTSKIIGFRIILELKE